MKYSSALLAAVGMGLSGKHAVELHPAYQGAWSNPYAPATDFKNKTYPKGKRHRIGVAAQKRAAKKLRNIRANSSKK